MAHKHSRRRQRPRSRNQDQASFGLYQHQSPDQPSFYDPTSFSTGASTNISWSNMAMLNKQGNHTLVNSDIRTIVPNYGSAVSRPRRFPKVGSKTIPSISPILMNKSELEEEQIKLFGGEPGDDPSLCFRMLEAFGRMEWIDG
jgi:hypothetical protein